MPPNIRMAEDHLLATRIARPADITGKENIDEASGFPV